MSDGKRTLISEDDALVIARHVLEAARSGPADTIALVNAALKKYGLRYASNSLNVQVVEHTAGDIVQFARPLTRC